MLPIIAVAQGDPAVVYVRCDYANYTSGGNGSDWEHAIHGNAYYHYDGTCDNDYKAVSFTGSDREVTSDTRFDRMTFIFQNQKRSGDIIYLKCKDDDITKFEWSDTKEGATEFYFYPARWDNGTITRYYICLKSNPKYKMESHAQGLGTDFTLVDETKTTLTTAYLWRIYKVGNTFYFENDDGKSFGRNVNNLPDGYGGSAWYFNQYWTIYDRQKGFQYALVKAKNGSKPSYVFVKEGNYIKTDGNARARDNAIVIPEGVHLYGGIENSFTEEASNYSTINDYVEKVKQTRPGIALSIDGRTKVRNVMTIETESYDTETVFDGLYVYGDNRNGTVDIDDGGKKKVTLCNSLVTGTTTITSGLFYNSLTLGNLVLSTNGYAANVTYSGTISTTGNKFNLKYKASQDNIYKYQLEDNEVDIDNLSNNTSFGALESFGAIDYDTDRDLLGNPRKMGSQVDVGAFEAWCVRDGIVKAEYDASRHNRPWNYYPIPNTNVFLMENSTFVLGDNLPAGYDFTPRKLLVKEGASLYGQGYNVNVNDITVALNIPAEGRIMSLPFSYDYSLKGTAKIYNGREDNGRAKPGYKLNSGNCWTSAPNPVPACQGVFFVPTTAGTVKFAATGTNVYTESGASKTVTLTQYDDNVSVANDASFTSAENMGWNCIGIPYLVSEYKPYLGSDGEAYTSGNYMMNIPHTLWLYYDNTNSYQPVPSWDGTDWHLGEEETGHLWLGEGFFTQTAAVSASEALTFYSPVYVEPASGDAKSISRTRHYAGAIKEQTEVGHQGDAYININRNILTVSNLKGDESIDIYTLEGMQKVKAEGNKGSYSCTLRSGMYVVKVNDLVKKVMVR